MAWPDALAAPRRRLLVAVGLAFLFSLVGLARVASTPSLGVKLAPVSEPPAVRVEQVASTSPNLDRLRPGTVLVAARVNGRRVPLNPTTLIEEPDLLDYRAYNRFLERQDLLYQALSQGRLEVVDADGRRILLRAAPTPWSPALGYALGHAAYGWVALLISLGIWVFSPLRAETRLFALSGLGVFGTTLTLAVYGGRELALDGTLLAWLMAVNHLSVLMVCAPLATLFWVYPVRQGQAPLPTLAVLLALLAWCADLAQLGPGARYTVYLPVTLGFLAGIVIMIFQWFASGRDPVARAAMKWCVLSIFVGSLLLMVLIMIPPALGLNRPMPLFVSLASILVLYLGLAAGLKRYRLFHLEQWWFKTWAWFFGGVLVLLLDAVLVLGIGWSGEHALLVALAVAGWVYFPVRQSLMRYLGRDRDDNLDVALQKLVDNLFTAQSEARIRAAWPDLLWRSFRPLRLVPVVEAPERHDVAVDADGTHLFVRALAHGEPHFRVGYPGDGGRLFRRADLRVAGLLRALTGQAIVAARAREAGAEVERQRIIRDLHDDLGGHILSLLRNAPNDQQAGLARQAMRSLRESLRALDEETVCRLADSVEDWHLECREKCHREAVTLRWHQSLRDRSITVRHDINVRRILGEALTNAFQHANPETVAISIRLSGENLMLECVNDGVPPCRRTTDDVLSGRGLTHMRTRAGELGGTFDFDIRDHKAWTRFSCPLD